MTTKKRATSDEPFESDGEDGEHEGSPPVGTSLPAGFIDANPATSQVYYKIAKGALVQGILCGIFTRRGRSAFRSDGTKSRYFQVRLTKPCASCVNAKREPVAAPVGTIINVDHRSALDGLVEPATDKKPIEVWINPLEQVALDSRRTYWRIQVGIKDAF
jgi:hypothetical protein